MKKLLFLCLVILPFMSLGQNRSFYFGKAQAGLLDSSSAALDSFYQLHLSDHKARLQLKGFADTIGSLRFNEELTAKRIATVLGYLEQKGFPVEQVQIEHIGEVATAAGQEWRNRRVQIVLEDQPSMYEQMLGKDYRTQVIPFRNTQDTILIGAEGTSLIIPKGAFEDGQGSIVKDVTIELKEYYEVEDIVLSNLSTITTDGQLMETNGMFNVKAYDENGNPCRVAKGKVIDVKVPGVRDATSMNLYKGKKKGGTIKWKRKSERAPFKYGVIRTHYSYVQKRKRYTSERAMALLEVYLKQNLRFPENAVNNNRCGRVKVEFHIDSEGNMVNPYIKGRGLPGAINKHVMKVFHAAPRLHASYFQDKRALSFKYSITLKFLTERCFRKLTKSKSEVLSWNWTNLQPVSFWNTLRDSKSVQVASNVLYRNGGLGWTNCDALVGVRDELVSMSVPQQHEANTDFKLLMLNRRIILSSEYDRGTLTFSSVLPTGKAWLLGIKYQDGQPSFSKTEVDLAEECPEPEPFRELSVEGLKAEIRKLET